MQALTIINLCAREYNDIGFLRVARDSVSAGSTNQANWLDWLNDAQRAVVLVRPDAHAVTENVTLVVGPRQTIPAGGLRLLNVTRNMGADGLTSGKAVQFTNHEAQNAVNRDWYSATPASPVREVIYDDKKDPLGFWTRPPAVAGWKLEATISKSPDDVTDAAVGAITIPDVYGAAMQEWMLFRAFGLATQALNQFQRAQFYLSSFFNLLGVKFKGEQVYAAAAAGALLK